MYTELTENIAITSLDLVEELTKYGPQYDIIIGKDNKVYQRSKNSLHFVYNFSQSPSEFSPIIEEAINGMCGPLSVAYNNSSSLGGIFERPFDKFPFPIGFEPTFLSKENLSQREIGRIADKIENKYGAEFDAMEDCGVLEIRTPVFKDMETLKTYFEKLFEIVEEFGFESHIGWKNTGGCHHHVDFRHISSVNEEATKIARNFFISQVFKDIWNRPYLNWIFQDYSDVSSSCHFSKSEKADLFKSYLRNKWIGGDFSEYTDGSTALRYQPNNGKGTLEFRIFDSVRNLEDIICQTNFTQHYLLSLYFELIGKREIEIREDVDFRVTDPSSLFCVYNSVHQFSNLLDKIGLKMSDYRFYINENYLHRISENKLLC